MFVRNSIWEEWSGFVPLSGDAILMNVIKGFDVVHSPGGNAWLPRLADVITCGGVSGWST